MSGCECDIVGGGWCARHQCMKTSSWVQLCRTRLDYFALWEAGRGPGQHKPEPPGLGDLVANGLAMIGITPERYVAVKGAVGLPRKCNCCGRKQKLNEWGRKIGIGREAT